MRRMIQTLLAVAYCSCSGAVLCADNPAQNNAVSVEEIDSAQYQDYIAKHDRVVVDVYAPWCPPCHRLAPIIEEVAQIYGRSECGEKIVSFVKVNLDNNRQLGSTLGVRSIPTLIFYYKGQEVTRVTGLLSPAALKSKIEQFFLVP